MTRIFDNITEDFGPQIAATFESSDRLDAAVGYFNLRGWEILSGIVASKPDTGVPVARILVGMTAADPHDRVSRLLQAAVTEDEPERDIDRDTARRRREYAIHRFRVQLMRGLPTERDEQTLRALRDHLDSGRVQVKLFTRRAMHAKTYICHRQDNIASIVGYVGSSNLTMSGLKHQYELNVDVVDNDAAGKLSKWFEDRWNDRFTIDITADLVELIDESWATDDQIDPYLVYLKVCYLLSQDAREGLVEYSLPASIRNQLLDYQASAVKTLTRRIVSRGGAMLGDVVGLGKTITAVAVAMMLREDHGYATLVVCPKNLVKMWEQYLENYEVVGKVVPYSMVDRELPDLKRYQFVIVDESHTVRNNDTIAHRALTDYIRGNDARVLLLTATPYNKRYLDVANQLALYIDDDDDLGLSPAAALASNHRIYDQVDGKVTSLAAFRRSEEPEDWRRLMSEHLVRRTRGFVRENFADYDHDEGREYLTFANGERFYFPDRVARPLEHAFGDTDPARLMIDDETLDTINALKLPRYHLAEYLRPGVTPKNGEGAVLHRLEKAGGNLLGFTRTSLFKRLSSCGHSFMVSLDRHLDRNDLYLHAIDNGLALPVGSILQTMFDEDDPDRDALHGTEDNAALNYRALRNRNPGAIDWVSSEMFTADLRTHIEEDNRAIRSLLARYGPWTQQADSKIDALAELLTSTHTDEKVLIFSEYKDTVEYVAQALRERGISDLAAVSGATSDPTSYARRFAPRSNSAFVHADPDDPLRVLVTTDVLSEGQNLQDAHIVVNYDLPWAIIKLIQRAGRVDRVGQESEKVLVYTFMPDSGVEGVLTLRDRIRERLDQNAEVFGSDEMFFGDEREHEQIRGLYSGRLTEDEEGEVDAASYAFQVWERAERDHPELADRAKSLPDLVNATKATRAAESETGVVVYVRTERGVDAFGVANQHGMQLLTGMEALRRMYAEPDTPGLSRTNQHFERVAALVRGPLKRPEAVAGQLRGIRQRVWQRLSGALATADADVEAALDELFRSPLTSEAEARLKQAIRERNNDDLADLLVLLNRDGRLVLNTTSSKDPLRIVCSMETVAP